MFAFAQHNHLCKAFNGWLPGRDGQEPAAQLIRTRPLPTNAVDLIHGLR
jgi:hypothetical protein